MHRVWHRCYFQEDADGVDDRLAEHQVSEEEMGGETKADWHVELIKFRERLCL